MTFRTSRRETRRVLKKARKLIRDVGFVQYTFAERNLDGSFCGYCSYGAVNAIAIGHPFPGSAERQAWLDGRGVVQDAMDELRKHLPLGHTGVPTFNDSHSREEVLAVFDKAIDNLKKENKK